VRAPREPPDSDLAARIVLAFDLVLRAVHLPAWYAGAWRPVVVVDEVDLHLHPWWQRGVVRQLVTLFPEAQFVFTTHSASVVQDAIDLDVGVVVLREEGGASHAAALDVDARRELSGAHVGSLLVDARLFGLRSRLSPRYEAMEAELAALRARVDAGEATEVLIKHRGSGPGGIAGTVHVQPHHPLDVVGWDGCLYPYAFDIADFEPITGRVHQPPPAHQVFEGAGFVICNFVPRKVDYHPLAIPVPYYHSNVDSDEVMFYVDGDYEARRGSGITTGSVSLHPGGHAHGPQPGAMEASIGKESFDETAVMVDTFAPLDLGEGGLACDDGVYAGSWSRQGGPSAT
jgi:hypothetical protein